MKNQKISKSLAPLLAAAMLLGCICIPALAAADVPSLNPGEKGSVSVTLDGVKDGTLTLFEVAELGLDSGNMAYTLTADFSGFEGKLVAEDAALAGKLEAFIAENGLTGLDAEVSSGGEAVFENLTLGLYIIVQSTQSTGFYSIEPFLVTVPVAENDRWVYHVDASPKTEVNPLPETTPTPGTSPTPSDTPETSVSPGESPVPSITSAPGGGGSASTGTPGSKLPQTGQLNWPVALFAVLGVIFVVAGIILVGRKEKSET